MRALGFVVALGAVAALIAGPALADWDHPVKWDQLVPDSWSGLSVIDPDGEDGIWEAFASPFGLLNYWRFDEGTGTTAFDSVGGPHGDVSGAQWITGQVNGALSFDGVDDFVHVPESPEWLLDSFSLELWIRTPQSHLRQGTILSTYGSSPGSVGFGIGIGGSVTRQGYLTEVSYRAEPYGPKVEMNTLDAGVRVDDNEWHLITLVRNNDIGRAFLYVDGMSVYETDDIGGTIDIPRDLFIGTVFYEGQYYPFCGAIDEVALFNRALSLEEIERHYTNGLSGKGYCYVVPEPSVFLLAGLALLALIRPRR